MCSFFNLKKNTFAFFPSCKNKVLFIDWFTITENCTKHNASMLHIESTYRARTDLLKKHVQVISDQRAQEMKSWAEKNQLQIK